MMCRPNDFEQVWILVYSSDLNSKLGSLNYFTEPGKVEAAVVEDRFRLHCQYVDKRVKTLKNQQHFLPWLFENTNHKPYQFGMTVIKRLCMRHQKLSKKEINLVLGLISGKLIRE